MQRPGPNIVLYMGIKSAIAKDDLFNWKTIISGGSNAGAGRGFVKFEPQVDPSVDLHWKTSMSGGNFAFVCVKKRN